MYLGLPKSLPDFYIRGYTEALAYFKGVRVIPSEEYVQSLSGDVRYLFHSTNSEGQSLSFPAYYVPIKMGREHYGFVIKSKGIKMTPSVSWWSGFKVTNLDALLDPRPYVVLVEGIKDAYLWLRSGHPVVVMTTARISKAFLEECKVRGKRWLFFAGDNDEAGKINFDESKPWSFVNRCRELELSPVDLFPESQKDWGAWFDVESKSEAQVLLNEFRTAEQKIVSVGVQYGRESSSYAHAV